MELNYHLTAANQPTHHISTKHIKKENGSKNEESRSSNDKVSGHDNEDDDSEEESDIDSDVDLNLGLSDEEYSDEEEYTMLVSHWLYRYFN